MPGGVQVRGMVGPARNRKGVRMSPLVAQLLNWLLTLGYALVAAVSMGIGLGVALKIFTMLTPGIDEIEELKKGNISVAVVIAAVIVSMGAVMAIAMVQ